MIFPFRDNVPSQRTPWVCYALIGLNAAVFLATRGVPAERQQLVALRFGFIPARMQQLVNPRPIVVPIERMAQHPHLPLPVRVQQPVVLPPDRADIVSTLFTCMFLHGGWLHILGNLWFLWVFGDNLEARLGHVPFLVLYLTGGLIASLVHWLSTPNSPIPVIGASGAVAAVLGAYAISWPLARIHSIVFLVFFVTAIELPALVVLGFWFLTQLLEAHHALRQGINGGVAWWAHVGGFVAGMLLMQVFTALIQPPNPPGQANAPDDPTLGLARQHE